MSESLSRPSRMRRRWLLAALGRPARVVATGFALAIVLGTVLLALPIATQAGVPSTNLVTAFVTASSAVS